MSGGFLQALFAQFVPRSSTEIVEDQDLFHLLPQNISTEVRRIFPLEQRSGLLEMIDEKPRLFQLLHPSWYPDIVDQQDKSLQAAAEVILQKPLSGYTVSDRFFLRYVLSRTSLFDQKEKGICAREPSEWLRKASYQELIDVISVASLVDLVDEVRQVIDKKMLQKILSTLTTLQKKYLKYLLHAPQKSMKFSSIDLIQGILEQNPRETVSSRLHEAGLHRLAILLKDEPASAVWRTVHLLDSWRGAIIEKYIESEHSLLAHESGRLSALFAHAYRFVVGNVNEA